MSKIQLFQKQFFFENQRLFHLICGIADQNILELERLFELEIIARGNSFILRSENEKKLNQIIEFFQYMENQFKNREIELFDIQYIFQIFQTFKDSLVKKEDLIQFIEQEKLFILHKGKTIFAKTINQYNYIQSLHKFPITIGIGPAGTGKTFLSVIVAAKFLQKGEIERIIITRPAVEAGENLGFLPGDMIQKVDPYLRPIYDALYDAFGVEKTTQLIQMNKIEIVPIAFMRGRTLSDAMIILDEAQNCTLNQLKMFLTRLGRNSRMCLSGDITQSDLKPGQSGLEKLIYILKKVKEVNIIHFSREDIVRNSVVEKIIEAFEQYENIRKNKNHKDELLS